MLVEGVKVAAKEIASCLVAGAIGIGEVTPFLAPIFVALRCAREAVQTARENREQLEALLDRCLVITTHVIAKCNTSSSQVNHLMMESARKRERDFFPLCGFPVSLYVQTI